MEISFVPFDEQFLQHSSRWLQDEQISVLIDAPALSAEAQQQWFQSLPQKKNYFIWGIEYDGIPVGVTGLKNVIGTEGEYWGYIGEKEYWGRGIGSAMISFIEKFAVSMSLYTITLRVLENNTRAISLYKKHGFSIVLAEKGLVKMAKQLSKNGR